MIPSSQEIKDQIDPRINEFRQRCFREYVQSVGLPAPYVYPDGNPIRPVLPVHVKTGSLMIVGAYPSARFEMRPSAADHKFRVVPVADNLHPFAVEEYFDGISVRRLTSGDELQSEYLRPLGKEAAECWITDLVKVFLYKPEHRESCADACSGFSAPVTRSDMLAYAKLSMSWLKEEVGLAKPKLVIALGEEVGRTIMGDHKTGNDELLAAAIVKPASLDERPTILMPHPEACRRMSDWRDRQAQQLVIAREFLRAAG